MARDIQPQSHLGSVGIDPTRSSDPEQQAIDRIMKAIEAGDRETAAAEYAEGRKLYGWKPPERQAAPSIYKPPASVMTPRTLPDELTR